MPDPIHPNMNSRPEMEMTADRPKYERAKPHPEIKWWCHSHKREATHVRIKHGNRTMCCEPGLGGILLPCFAEPIPRTLRCEG